APRREAGPAGGDRRPDVARRVRGAGGQHGPGWEPGWPARAHARASGEGIEMIKAEEISEIIKRQLAGYEAEVDMQEVGRVIEVGDGIARIYGLEKAMAGE